MTDAVTKSSLTNNEVNTIHSESGGSASSQQCINLYLDWTESGEHAAAAVMALLLDAFASCKTLLRIRFSSGAYSWNDLFSFTDILCSNRKQSLRLDLEGPVSEFRETTLQRIFERRFLIRWPITFSKSTPIDWDSLHAIRPITEYGIPVIANTYIGAGLAPDAVVSNIEELLSINLSSGFALYPCSYNINSHESHVSPSVRSWLELLVAVYKRFPHFDINFDPLLELVDLSVSGGITQQYGIPRYMGVRVCPDSSVSLFRQNPNKSIPWLKRDSIMNMTAQEIWDNFVLHVKNRLYNDSRVDAQCRFQGVCGGIDSACVHKMEPELECETRCFFLESFLAQKQIIANRNNDV
ncbi:MAG: hypothetical protein Q4G68_06540 [Planctomycetia bacterium]|nr:hypothetical protein [Planctomycetia bacterium]